MAPEIFQKGEILRGHSDCQSRKLISPTVQYGKPVDVWAMGVIAYYILGGQRLLCRQFYNPK